jgi:hypothetical protein
MLTYAVTADLNLEAKDLDIKKYLDLTAVNVNLGDLVRDRQTND